MLYLLVYWAKKAVTVAEISVYSYCRVYKSAKRDALGELTITAKQARAEHEGYVEYAGKTRCFDDKALVERGSVWFNSIV